MKKRIRPLTIAVCIHPELAREAALLSRVLRRKGGLYTLGVRRLPHITLYRGHFPAKNMPELKRRLRRAVGSLGRFSLASLGYRQSGLGYIDVSYAQMRAVLTLQTRIIEALNPLREGALDEREGKLISNTSKAQQKYFKRYGYDFVGKYFIPHLTLSKLARYDKNALRVLAPRDFSFEVRKIGIFEPGPEHTCRRLIGAFALSK